MTIAEVRPPWDGVASTPVSRSPVFATPRRPESGRSTLRDRNLNFHEYDRKLPSKNVQALLDYIAESGDPIFWG